MNHKHRNHHHSRHHSRHHRISSSPPRPQQLRRNTSPMHIHIGPHFLALITRTRDQYYHPPLDSTLASTPSSARPPGDLHRLPPKHLRPLPPPIQRCPEYPQSSNRPITAQCRLGHGHSRRGLKMSAWNAIPRIPPLSARAPSTTARPRSSTASPTSTAKASTRARAPTSTRPLPRRSRRPRPT